MNDQLANGYITLGSVQSKYGDVPGAEDFFNKALTFASNFKLKRYEALAYLNLAVVSGQRRRFDEAEQFLEKARAFFIDGGYRREADIHTIALARSRRQRGDNDGALKLLEEPLRIAEQTGDPAHVASLHHECGAALINQEKYAEALVHFSESVSASRSLRIQTLLPYSLISMSSSLWALGHYVEAEQILDELAAADPQTLSGGKGLLAPIHLNRADLELSRQRYPEAAARAREAVNVLKEVGGERKDMMMAWANSDLGMAESFGGAPSRAKSLCQEAVSFASRSGDDWATMYAHYALALVLLKAGDGAGARAAAESALKLGTHLGRADTQWRTLVLAGKASRLVGDHEAARNYFDRAAATLAQFEQSLGAEAAGYRSRPDMQWLRSELGVPVASASVR